MKLKYFLFLFLTLTIIHQTSSIATIRYVSKTGTSQPPYTTWQTAADSIQKCINICVDGDTIYVANGIYKENLVINTALSLIGSSMDSTVIDGTEMGTSTVRMNQDTQVFNLNVIGAGRDITQSAAIIAFKNTEIKYCKISNAVVGIAMYNSSISSSIHNVFFSGTYYGYQGDGLNPNSTNLITNNLFVLDHGSGCGIRLSFDGNYSISNNILFCNSENRVGIGVSLGSPRRVMNNNNLIGGLQVHISVDQVFDTVFIYNNTLLYKVTRGLEGDGAIDTENDYAVIKNNIFQNNKDYAVRGFPPYVDLNYNLYWQNQNDLYGLTYGDSDIVTDPMFVKDTIPTANGSYDFHLQKYSPAIDKGDPSILDIDGSRSDIGLFGGPLGQKYTYLDLAPKPPRNLTASMDSGLVHLKWNKNTEADLFRYRVYRDTVPDFIYDTTKIIAVIPDTVFYDDPPQKFISGNYYYKITAIDSAYNQSPASEEAHINITGIPEAPPIVVEHYNLLQNYPNPFNPSTTIPYRLKAPGYVKVMVYNLLGEQVKVLVNKYQSAGYYEVFFNPTATERQSAEGKIEFETGYGDIVSGIYLYRIEVIGEGNIPVFTDMKKMLMIK